MIFKKRLNLLIKSIKLNKNFCIKYIIILFFLSYNYGKNNFFIINFFNSFISLIVVFIYGWFVHYISHNVNFYSFYKKTIIHKFLKEKCSYLDKIFLFINKHHCDFHDKVHHNKKINKNIYNLIKESFQNILSISISLILINNLCDLNLNNLVILSYGLLYSSVHNINYNLKKNKNHELHHKNKFTNYGIDFIDIIFDTKYNKKLEDLNEDSNNLNYIYFLLVICKNLKLLNFLNI